MAIHPSSIVAPSAKLAHDVDVGPFCTVGPDVSLAPGVRLISHVSVLGHTDLREGVVVHPFASVGGEPQDLKYQGEAGRLIVGRDTTIRESATLNIGTAHGKLATRVGERCLIMAYAHVAHDCTLGNGVVLANGVALAGHVEIGDNAILGGLAAIHQFCRVGRLAFIGGGSMVAQDVPPFCVAQGDRATLAGLNVVGLKRAGWSRDRIHRLRRIIRNLFARGISRAEALDALEEQLAHPVDREEGEVQELCLFMRDAQRGILSARRMAETLAVQAAN